MPCAPPFRPPAASDRASRRQRVAEEPGEKPRVAAHSVALHPVALHPVAEALVLNRMGIALLALVGVLISVYMTAYKFGLIGSIMCGTGGCETVQNSPWAVFMGVPVPIIGLAGYGLLVVTALLGLQPRFMDDRRIAIVLLAAALIGAAFSAYLTYLEASVIHAWCRWCIVSAVLAGLILLAALPEIGRLGRSDPA